MNRIQSFWFGKTISTMERLCITSFLKNGHPVDIYTYDGILNLPEEVNQLDANQVLDKELIFFDSSGGIAAFSDWFRYKLLYDKGGWWSDLDVICLQHFNITDDYCFATENFGYNYQTAVTSCVIKSPANAEYLKVILNHISAFNNYQNIKWGQFGPGLIHSVLEKFDSSRFVQPVNMFCPINWTEMRTMVNEDRELPANALAIHMWNNLWRQNQIDKESSYQPNCIYERLKAKYL